MLQRSVKKLTLFLKRPAWVLSLCLCASIIGGVVYVKCTEVFYTSATTIVFNSVPNSAVQSLWGTVLTATPAGLDEITSEVGAKYFSTLDGDEFFRHLAEEFAKHAELSELRTRLEQLVAPEKPELKNLLRQSLSVIFSHTRYNTLTLKARTANRADALQLGDFFATQAINYLKQNDQKDFEETKEHLATQIGESEAKIARIRKDFSDAKVQSSTQALHALSDLEEVLRTTVALINENNFMNSEKTGAERKSTRVQQGPDLVSKVQKQVVSLLRLHEEGFADLSRFTSQIAQLTAKVRAGFDSENRKNSDPDTQNANLLKAAEGVKQALSKIESEISTQSFKRDRTVPLNRLRALEVERTFTSSLYQKLLRVELNLSMLANRIRISQAPRIILSTKPELLHVLFAWGVMGLFVAGLLMFVGSLFDENGNRLVPAESFLPRSLEPSKAQSHPSSEGNRKNPFSPFDDG